MELIRDIGMKGSGKTKRRFGIYICPSCLEEVESRFDYGHKALTCKKCINKTHGKTDSRLFSIWTRIKQRVKDKSRRIFNNFNL